jgi:pyruvate formate lyase activating enzyme
VEIKGFKKTTFLDYPDKLASIIFTGSCNFRCSYCHNGSLVDTAKIDPKSISEYEVLDYLKSKKNILEGLVISGGEPTLCDGLIEFMKKVKDIGLDIKLDTNGYRPDVLKKIIEMRLVDYIAMDLKNTFKKYSSTVGVKNFDVDKIKMSMDLIRNSGVKYEFRTTIMKEYHNVEDIKDLRNMIRKNEKLILQQYKKVDLQLSSQEFSFYTLNEMNDFRDEIFKKNEFDNIKVRAYV